VGVAAVRRCMRSLQPGGANPELGNSNPGLGNPNLSEKEDRLG
jgi:hypothetical protein